MIAVSSRTQQSEQAVHNDSVDDEDCDEVEDVAGVNIVHGVGVLVD